MRVLLTINGTDFGGTESALAELARHLDLRGHDVKVLSLKPPGRTGQRLTDQGIDVHSLDMEEVVSPVSMLQATWQMRRWLMAHPVDVVHSFLPRANVISRLANRLTPGSRPHFSAERSTDYNRSAMVCRLNRWTCRWTHRVLAISPMIRELLQRRDGIPVDKIEILENGIDLDHVDSVAKTEIRRQLNLPPSAVLFCTVGRLIPDKGYVYLTQAMAEVTAGEGEDPPVHLVIVGEGDEEGAIRQEIERHGLGKCIHLVGFRRDVLGILKDVDAFVLTSLEEGIPVVLLEAMASGLPVVSSAVGGIPDLVDDGVTATLVPPAEDWQQRRPGTDSGPPDEAQRRMGVDALATAMQRMVRDTDRRRMMGDAGRQRIEEIFGLERIVSKLEDFYHSSLGSR